MSDEDVSRFFGKENSHRFAVSFNGNPHVKRKVVLDGPFLGIYDQEKIDPPVNIYLLQWSSYVRENPTHNTLVLKEEINNSKNIVKIKSKNKYLVEKWNNLIIDTRLKMDGIAIYQASFRIFALFKGKKEKCELNIINDAIKLTDSNGILFEANRHEGTFAHPLNEGSYRIMLKKRQDEIKLFFKKEVDYKTALIVLNSQVPEVDVDKQLTLDDVHVPDLNMSIGEFIPEAKPRKKTPQAIDRNTRCSIIIEDGAFTQTQAGKIIDTSNPEYVKEEISKRYTTLIKKINSSDEHNTTMELTSLIDSRPRKKYVHPADTMPDIPNFDDKPAFYVNDYVFMAHDPIPRAREDITLSDQFSLAAAKKKLNSIRGMRKFNCPDVFVTPMRRVYDVIMQTDWPDRPSLAAGIILNGIRVSKQELSTALTQVQFAVGEISILIRSYRFKDNFGCYQLFQRLFISNLTYSFFKSLELDEDFLFKNYRCDALIRCHGFCTQLALEFDAAVTSKHFRPLPFCNEAVPYVIAADSMRRLRASKHTEAVQCEKSFHEGSAIGDIMFALTYIWGGCNSSVRLRDVWLEESKRKRYPEALADINGKTAEENTVAFFSNLIMQRNIVNYLINMTDDSKYSQVAQIIVLTAAELCELHQFYLLLEPGNFLGSTARYILSRLQAIR